MITVSAAHSSGRFDRPLQAQAREIQDMSEIPKITLTTHTEQKNDSPARDETFDARGWDWFQSSRDQQGFDECVARWRKDSWEPLSRPQVLVLSGQTWIRSQEYGGRQAPPVVVLHVPLRYVGTKVDGLRVSLMVAHMVVPNTPKREQIWDADAAALVKITKNIRREDRQRRIILNADWNKDFRKPEDYKRIQRKVARPAGLKQAWNGDNPEIGGTHGLQHKEGRGTLIDGTLHNFRRGEAYLLPDSKASDHRPYGVDLFL